MNRICTLFLITIFTSGVCYGETNINLLLKTDTIEICVGDSVQLVSELQGLIYYWTPKENITTDSVPYTTVTPSQTTTYILTALNPDLDQELIMNGDFEDGNIDFSTNYTYKLPGTGIYIEGEYTVSDDPSQQHNDFAPCPDHTSGTGQMMIVNGDSVELITVWEEFIMQVDQETIYAFSTWLQTVVDRDPDEIRPAKLQFWINNELLDEPFEATYEICDWQQFYTLWDSKQENRATIRIVNQNLAPGGNDFGLDDISFAPLIPEQDTFHIIVHDYPVVDLGNDTIIDYGGEITLNAGNPGADYSWSTGSTSQEISIYNIEDAIVVSVIVDTYGCQSSDEIVIGVTCDIGVPTGFSPNGDGENDVLKVLGTGFANLDFMVFSRFGELVFQTDDLGLGWDGTFQGREQPAEVYIYYLKAVCLNGGQITRQGNVTLLR